MILNSSHLPEKVALELHREKFECLDHEIGKTSSMISFLDGNQYSYPRSFSSPHSTYSEDTSLLQSLELLAPRACS